MAEANNAALYDARRRNGASEVLDNIVSGSNCGLPNFCVVMSGGAAMGG